MKLLRYLFRKWMLPLYFFASVVISLVFTLAAGAGVPVFLRMLPVVLCILLLLRVLDDCFDFELDSTRKTQYLGKSELIGAACVIAAIYVTLNVLFYGLIGFFCLIAVGYILLQEKLPPIKSAYMTLLFLYYFYVNRTAIGAVQIAVLTGCLAVSASYHIMKRRGGK